MNGKELIGIIQPNGFELDFHLSDTSINKHMMLFYDQIYQYYQDDKDKALFFLGLLTQKGEMSESIGYLKKIAEFYITKLTKTVDIEILRDNVVIEINEVDVETLLWSAPYIIGEEYLSKDWFINIWNCLNHTFSKIISTYNGTVEQFFASYNGNLHLIGRVFFHLVESKKEEYPFAFLATYSSIVSSNGKSKHLPLKNALIEYGKDSQKLLSILSTVNKASQNSEFIKKLIDSGEIFHPIGMTINEAYTFLKEIPLYEESGILCRIPNWWKKNKNSLKMKLILGNDNPTKLNQSAVMDFNIELSLGGEKISAEDLQKLLSSSTGLALIKGKWVEVDSDKLKETLNAYEKAQKMMDQENINIIQAMRFQLNSSQLINIEEDVCDIEISHGKWLQSTLSQLKNIEKIKKIDCGINFKAHLRPYQEQGLYWLYHMKTLGLGACLADDMGLGKTIQVIAFLNHISTNEKEKNLLVIPASLIGNWMNELDKFAPTLNYYVLHSSENKLKDDTIDLKIYDLTITTYNMLLRYDWLKEVSWDCLILDEAQAIKNPQTKQSRIAKQLKAKFRIALTGTPIENRLSDLWSLFDFLNQGLLGNQSEFKELKKKIQEKEDGYAKLKRVVSPFVLRRLKTDKSIINDLPDKIEMKTYATLSKKQAVLYQSLVQNIKYLLENSEGIKRKGLILSSLMKFKQICNHPDQYQGQIVFDENESGKFIRLKEICETIYQKRERVLVFTQFREMVKPLHDFLKTIFLHDGLMIHGGTPVKKRKPIVEKFQSDEYVPFMILSLKAAGVGLNLTNANHVIHFDRWWNPAVENQATDRAFRIGQKKNVVVHKFVTKGTIEEKIDALIEDKIKIARDIIPDAQENWITEMNNNDLMDLFQLKF